MGKAVIYTRVSTEEQSKGYSLDAQKEKCIKYCKEKGYEVLEIITDTSSGKDINRDGIRKVIALAEQNDGLIIVGQERDRIGRGKAIAQLEGVFLYKGFSTRIETLDNPNLTDEEELTAGIQDTVSGYERIKIEKRLKKGKNQKFMQGGIVNKAPFGYKIKINEDGKREAVPSDKFGVAKLIFNMRLQGKNYSEIVKESGLYEGRTLPEYKFKDGKILDNGREYGRVAKIIGVKYILKNVFYAGYVAYNGQICKGKHKPVVSLNDFFLVNECDSFEKFCEKKGFIYQT